MERTFERVWLPSFPAVCISSVLSNFCLPEQWGLFWPNSFHEKEAWKMIFLGFGLVFAFAYAFPCILALVFL